MDAPVSRTEEPSLAPEPSPPVAEPAPSAPADNPAPPSRSRASRRKTTQLAPLDEAALASMPSEMQTATLEDRIRRLEDALAQMQQSQGRSPPPAAQIQLPPAATPPPEPSASELLLGVGKRLFRTPTPTPVAPAPPPVATPAAAPSSASTSRLWLLLDAVAELRAIFRMFVDPRYHLPWSARALPLILLAAILTSYYWVPTAATIPFVGSWVNKAVDLILAFFLFKILGHESRRYRETSPDLPSHLRL